MAPAAVASDSFALLSYELHLTNLSDAALSISSVQIFDQDGTALFDLPSCSALAPQLSILGRSGSEADACTVAAGLRAVLYLDLAAGNARGLQHRVRYAAAGNASDATTVLDGARVEVDDRPPVVLGPPLRGGPWVAVHDPAWPRGHRRVLYTVAGRTHIPGRYAIDWIRVDRDGHLAGDRDRVATWFGYGADVIAVADATVAATRDDVAESASVSAQVKHAIRDAAGNYVALDLGNGQYAFYEHLRPGSVRVRVGQRVRRGEVVAALGFTGDSTGPHLHFHVADASSPLDAEGVPYAFGDFDLLGRYPSLDQFGKVPWQSQPGRHRSHEWPASNTVVQFAD